jgi:dihydropteroate synthase
MGVVNVTPDSFSDGGRFLDRAAAISQARRLSDEGADIVDIGGESSRPGAGQVSEEEDCAASSPSSTRFRTCASRSTRAVPG